MRGSKRALAQCQQQAQDFVQGQPPPVPAPARVSRASGPSSRRRSTTTRRSTSRASRRASVSSECGASGATVCGVLGESNRLTDAERAQLVETAVGAAGAMPVCVGVSHAGTRATVDLAQMAQDLGAHSVMVTPTKEAFPQSDAQLFDYFAAVQDGCALPIVLQDHPASTGVFMSAELLVQICAHLASVQCIKLEAVPTPPKIAALRKAWAAQPPAFPECSILTGLGALYGGFDVEQGTDGFMTGFAFPEVPDRLRCNLHMRQSTGDRARRARATWNGRTPSTRSSCPCWFLSSNRASGSARRSTD